MNDNPTNTPANNATNNATPLDEELVAYLDGELDAEGVRRIEALLASDPEVRRRVQSLERTWDMLDELDAAPVGEPFTQTTLEMVAVAARQDAEQSRAEAPRRRRRLLLAVGGGLLAAAAVGFCAVALHDPDRQLLQDLPVLEHLDEYHQIGSTEFLHRLSKEGLFSKDAAEPGKEAAADDKSAVSRRQRVENMSLDEKEQLLHAEDHFTALAAAEQQRLRRLHDDIENDPDSKRLRAIMHGYYEWLKTLSPLSWGELPDMGPDERIAWVKKRLQEEQRERGRQFDAKDMAALRDWMDGCALRHEADFLKSMPTEKDRKQFLAADKSFQRQMVVGYLWWRWQPSNSGKLPPMMTNEDMASLLAMLSPDVRKQLEKKNPGEQWRLVTSRMHQGFRRAFEDRRLRGPLSQSDDEQLAEFFEKRLSDEERDRLLSMPGEQMQRELQRLFQMRNRPLEGPGRRGRWPGDPERPAPGGPGPMRPLPPPMAN
jgi:hypothetical protein